jgi:UDP-glucose 4-epimerase
VKILVVGGAGYIGSICAELLLDEGHSVGIFDNLTEGHRRAVDSRAELIEGDLSQREQIEAALNRLKPDAVMHFAASALVGESMENPSKYFRNNVANGLNLLDAMVATGVKRLVFPRRAPPSDRPSGSRSTRRSRSARSIRTVNRSSHLSASCAGTMKSTGLRFVALRYFNAAGASANFGEDHRIETHLIPNILKVALGQKSHVEIYGTDYETPDGTCIRDYIHILDLGQAHILALDPPRSEFYNIGTGGGTSVREVIDTCRRITGHEIPVVEKTRRAGDPPRLIAASEKIKRELGWQPRYQRIDAIIESAWKWHQKFPNGYGD